MARSGELQLNEGMTKYPAACMIKPDQRFTSSAGYFILSLGFDAENGGQPCLLKR